MFGTYPLKLSDAKKILNVIKSLAEKGLTMVIVTHEMGFAREISDTVVFIKNGIIEDMGSSNYIFNNTKNESTKKFLNSIL